VERVPFPGEAAALETRNTSLADEVIARDNDVDRLHWLIARQTNIILKNASLSRKMGVSTSMVVNIFIISPDLNIFIISPDHRAYRGPCCQVR
jgi:hypothetical protein